MSTRLLGTTLRNLDFLPIDGTLAIDDRPKQCHLKAVSIPDVKPRTVSYLFSIRPADLAALGRSFFSHAVLSQVVNVLKITSLAQERCDKPRLCGCVYQKIRT